MHSNDVKNKVYMRSILLVYMPWYETFPINTDDPQLENIFNKFIKDKKNCPESVRLDYYRAIIKKNMHKEPIAANEDID